MATTENGLLRGLRGKVGPVVVCNGDEVSIIRIMPKKSTKPPGLAQLSQRAAFKAVIDFVHQVHIVMGIGYQAFKKSVSPVNAAAAYHLKNALIGVYPDNKVDLTKVKISKIGGGLSEMPTAKMVAAVGNHLNITWDLDIGYSDSELVNRNLDKLILLLFDETSGYSYTNTSFTRVLGAASVRLSSVFVGGKVHGYCFFAAADGKVSGSQYLGTAIVVA